MASVILLVADLVAPGLQRLDDPIDARRASGWKQIFGADYDGDEAAAIWDLQCKLLAGVSH